MGFFNNKKNKANSTNEDIKSVKGVMLAFSVLFVALIGYMVYFQMFKAADIAAKPINPRNQMKSGQVVRGSIYDRTGNPKEDPEKGLIAKSEALPAGSDGAPEPGTPNYEREKIAWLTKGTPQERTYVDDGLFCHIVGHNVGTRMGLESKYNNVLTNSSAATSKTSLLNLLDDFSIDGIRKLIKNTDDDEVKIGDSVITTLSPKLQKAASNAFDSVDFASGGTKKGAVVVMDVKTGEVLACVSKPGFNPNDTEAITNILNNNDDKNLTLTNRATAGLFAPGSTFKTVTLASALQNIPGVTGQAFDDSSMKLEIANLPNAEGDAPSFNLKDAYSNSSNVIFGQLALDLQSDKLKKTAEGFGFNQDITPEGFGLEISQFPDVNNVDKPLLARSGIGQGHILATPMQMCMVAAAVANDGELMQPTLVHKIVDSTGKEVKTKIGTDGKTEKLVTTKSLGNALSKQDAATIREYMGYTVETHAADNWPWFQGVDAGGKTGTAEAQDENGNFLPNTTWFIGIAPVNNPKYAVAVLCQGSGGYGGDTAGKVAAEVFKAALSGIEEEGMK